MHMWAYYTQAAPLLSNVAVLCVLAMLICSVCTFFEGMLDDCSKPELENMVLRQMAFESIFTAEKLAFSDEEFQQEYEEAKREFEESNSEFDDARLQEQVTENLKVCLFAAVMVAAVEALTFTVGFAFCLIEQNSGCFCSLYCCKDADCVYQMLAELLEEKAALI